MSFDTLSNRVTYTGAGNQDTYSVPFPFLSEEDLVLELVNTDDEVVPLVLDTDYTVDVDDETITLLAGNLSSGYLLTIRRVLSLTQETQLRNQGPYFPETIESAIDRVVMIAQQLQEQINRAITISSADETVDMELPIAALRSGKFLAFDADGTPIMASGITEVPVSAFMETLLDDASASAVLTTLGFSAYFKTLVGSVDASALQTLLGMSAFFKTLLPASDAAAFRTAIGAGVAPSIQESSVAEWTAWPSVANAQWVDLATITLAAGTWELYFHVNSRFDLGSGPVVQYQYGIGTLTGNNAPDVTPGALLNKVCPHVDVSVDGSNLELDTQCSIPVKVEPVSSTTYRLKAYFDNASHNGDYQYYQYGCRLYARKIS